MCDITAQMPLQATPHMSPSIRSMPRDAQESGNGTHEAVSIEGGSSGSQQVMVGGPGPSRPIVAQFSRTPPQNARDVSTDTAVLSTTFEPPRRQEFGEHHLMHTRGPGATAMAFPPLAHSGPGTPNTINTIIANPHRHNGAGADVNAANQSGQVPSTGVTVATTSTASSHAPSQPKHTEGLSKTPPLSFTIDCNTSHSIKPQHRSSPYITLESKSQFAPQTHTPTAAEIALGIPSQWSRSSGKHQVMAHDSQRQHQVSPDISNPGEVDITSVIESLSEVKDREEESTSRTSETGLVTSPGRMTPVDGSSDHGEPELQRVAVAAMGTPSTVSTAPSTDDASLGTDYKLDDTLAPNPLAGALGHSRSHSWGQEGSLLDMPLHNPQHRQETGSPWLHSLPNPTLSPAPSTPAWGTPRAGQRQQRVASFREGIAQPDSPMNLEEQHWQQHQAQPYAQANMPQNHHFPVEQQVQYNAQGGRTASVPIDQSYIRAYQGPRKQGYAPSASVGPSLVGTPPRPRNQRQQPTPGQVGHRQSPAERQGSNPHQSGPNPQRSASEILKTLLRKKACLYEPDTSRSVALVTWLVGRELALEYGFFSRQQLQSGVHACVASKIENATITRTKVNRCMQIILNSCFHYIIPRSDGSEEKGDSFKTAFSTSVKDDSHLLNELPSPWNDLEVMASTVIAASLIDAEDKQPQLSRSPTTPKSSPMLGSANQERSPGKDTKETDDAESKRAVLLCFNENVRSAEDVFRCHNEFIRDTANAAHLQLTAREWRTFFGRGASRAPYLTGNAGDADLQGGSSRQPDILGQMTEDEVGKFRTTWCAKRYDHDHDLCGFAHVDVNGGWLRRNPSQFAYSEEMCQFISTAGDARVGPHFFFVNECPRGKHCHNAHSMEEIVYHPNRYKKRPCTSMYSRSGGCQLGDVCPNLHHSEPNRPFKKPNDSRSHGSRYQRRNDQANVTAKAAVANPSGSPVVFANPAPFSSFERQLAMPGLQNLFRRQCSVVRAHVRTSGRATCAYSCFGDDWGITMSLPQAPKSRSGLPPSGNF